MTPSCRLEAFSPWLDVFFRPPALFTGRETVCPERKRLCRAAVSFCRGHVKERRMRPLDCESCCVGPAPPPFPNKASKVGNKTPERPKLPRLNFRQRESSPPVTRFYVARAEAKERSCFPSWRITGLRWREGGAWEQSCFRDPQTSEQ